MLQMLYSVLQNLIGNQLLFGLKWIQYKCIGVELYSCSTYHKGNARARSKEEHTVYRQKMISSIIKFQKNAYEGLEKVQFGDNVGTMLMDNKLYLAFDEIMLYIATTKNELKKYGIKKINESVK